MGSVRTGPQSEAGSLNSLAGDHGPGALGTVLQRGHHQITLGSFPKIFSSTEACLTAGTPQSLSCSQTLSLEDCQGQLELLDITW